MVVFEQRASTILYKILISLKHKGTFILPANVCPIVVATFLKAKRSIEFIDIDKKTLCINADTVINKISENGSKYAGILFVRTYGVMDSFENFYAQLKLLNSDLFIIDDKCLAKPFFDEKMEIADVNLYSTGYSKYVNIGWGGLANMKIEVAYNQDSNLIFNTASHDNLTIHFNKVIKKESEFDFGLIDTHWLDISIPEISVEEYISKINVEFAASNKMKEEMNLFFKTNILPIAQLPMKFQNWRYNIVVNEKDILLKQIFESGMFASSHYVPSTQIYYNESFEVSDMLGSKVINLFTDNCFPKNRLSDLVETVNKHVEKFG